jgi:hypothetical protein
MMEYYFLITRKIMQTTYRIPNTPAFAYDEDWLLHYIDDLTVQQYYNLSSQHDSELIICSDASVTPNNAYIAAVLTANAQVLITISHRIPLTYHLFTSYRVEAIGILQALRTILHVATLRTNSNTWHYPTVIFLCDNKSVIDVINKQKR